MTYEKLCENLLYGLFGRRFRPITGLANLPNGTFIVAVNHIDWLDGLLLTVALTKAFGDRQFQFVARTNNWWILGDHYIRIDPTAPGQSLVQAKQAIQRNRNIGFFIEGARNNTTRLLPGKTGCARLALLTGLPVVPIGLMGPSHRSTIQAIIRLPSILDQLRIQIGEPMSFTKLPENEIDRALLDTKTRVIMEKIGGLCGKTTFN